MSSAEAPFATAFAGQRRALELTHRAMSQGLSVQRRVVKSFVDNVDAQREASERATEFVDSALETTMLMANASVPGEAAAFEDFEYRFDEQLEAFDELQDATWTMLARSMEDGLSAYEGYADVYAEAIDASFEAAIEGTDWMSDEVAGLANRRERAVEIDIEVGE